MKRERMLAGARALEKGLQVIDQDSIEEMVLGLASLVSTGRVVQVGCHDADEQATCVPSKAVADCGDVATPDALARFDSSQCP